MTKADDSSPDLIQDVLEKTQEAYTAMDIADDVAIIADMEGGKKEFEALVYRFKNKRGQEVTDLSKEGVDWASREFAKKGEAIRIEGEPKMFIDPSNPDYVIAVAKAQRWTVRVHNDKVVEVPLDNQIGVKRQPVFLELRNGERIPDDFYAEKAMSKAVRNAKKSLLPKSFIKEVIERAIKGEHVRDIKGSQSSQTQKKETGGRQHPAAGKEHEKPKPDEKTQTQDLNAKRQRVVAGLRKVLHLSDEAVPKVYKDLTGEESLKMASEALVDSLIVALEEVHREVNVVETGPDGKVRILKKADKSPVFPKVTTPPPQQEPAAPVNEQDALF